MNSSLNPLVLLTFIPFVGVLVIVLLKKQQKTAIRWTALITSLLAFLSLCGWSLILTPTTRSFR